MKHLSILVTIVLISLSLVGCYYDEIDLQNSYDDGFSDGYNSSSRQ